MSGFAQLNLSNTLPRFIPKAGRETGKFIASCYGASAFAALVGGLVFVTVLPRLSSQWQFVDRSVLLSLAFVVAAVVWGVFALQDIVLLSLHRPMLVPVENFVYGVCKLLILVALAWTLRSDGIFISWVIPLAAIVPAVTWLIFGRFVKDGDRAVAPGRVHVREVVRFASVDYLGYALSQSYGNLLPLMVLSVLGAAANGSFYIAWTIASGLGLVGINFSTSLLVEGAAAPHRLAELTRGVLIRSVAITSFGAGVLLLAGRYVLDIYGTGYAHAAPLLGLLALGAIPSCLVAIVISLDRIADQVGRATFTRLVLTALILGGSWFLVKKAGIEGVALAWVGANLVVALARFPTIAGAAGRRRSGLDQRATSGRHRAGDPRAGRPDRLARSLMPPAADAGRRT
ncbi:MAG: hypothetical protein JO037_14505 [Actinobacteria bacterium]|nr:hypothetical protein [Actinomycetota bacterium]